MSNQLVNAIHKAGADGLGVTAAEYTVLNTIACFHNHLTGQCNPSIPTIAAKCGKGLRTTSDALASLRVKGLISSKQKAGRRVWFYFHLPEPRQETTNPPVQEPPSSSADVGCPVFAACESGTGEKPARPTADFDSPVSRAISRTVLPWAFFVAISAGRQAASNPDARARPDRYENRLEYLLDRSRARLLCSRRPKRITFRRAHAHGKSGQTSVHP